MTETLTIAGSHVVIDGAGPPVVLVHGVGSDLQSWVGQVPALARRYRVVRYDTLGHGRTPMPDGEVTLQSYADQLQAVRAALGLARFALVGFSMGVPIGQLFAFAHSGDLAGLVLMSGVYDRSPEQREAVRARLRQAQAGGRAVLADAALERWLTPEYRAAHPDVEAAIRKRLADNDSTSFLAAYRIFAEADPWVVGRLGEIRCPTLVATGEHDPGSTPAMTERMAKEIPNARSHVMPRLRHMAQHEGAELVNRLLLDFLDGLPREGDAWR